MLILDELYFAIFSFVISFIILNITINYRKNKQEFSKSETLTESVCSKIEVHAQNFDYIVVDTLSRENSNGRRSDCTDSCGLMAYETKIHNYAK
jgi:hypothetical protein